MITKIEINNFKSIKNATFDFRENHESIVCLLGKNGSGKSNIIKAILYFWEHLCDDYSSINICDNINPYNQKAEIAITYDLELIRVKAKYNEKLKSDIDYLEKSFSGETNFFMVNSIEMKMMQNKKGKISWTVQDIRVRRIIKSLFPIYFINTRALDIFTWDKIWGVISDLSVTKPKKSESEAADILNDAFENIFGKKYGDVEKILSEIFKQQKISLDKYHFDSKFKSAFAMRFGGTSFQFDSMNLEFYSDGTNSYKYLLLFLELVSKLTIFSSKYPVILLDEPEIGMHPYYISNFVRFVCENIPKNALLFVNTHSPELIKDLSKSVSDTGNTSIFLLYQVYYQRLYTYLRKMNSKFLLENKDIITLNETDCYFYDAIVYVEGKTESQLFNNCYLRKLFPKLRMVNFYVCGSDDVNLQLVSAENMNLGTKYKFLVDIDKIISYNNGSFHLKTKSDINPLTNETRISRLKYQYYNRRAFPKEEYVNHIKDLLKMSYKYKIGAHYIEDDNFNELMVSIISYCKTENVIVNWSTIEGELITYENIDKFILFLQNVGISKNKINQHTNICNVADNKEKTVLVLAEMNGRTEIQEGSSKHPVKINSTTKVESGLIGKKTSGWVNSWMEYYYNNYLEGKDNPRSIFKNDFPSLYRTLQIVESMV